MASIGARVNSEGSRECVLCPRIFASGVKELDVTPSVLASTKADAPSEIELEFAAVTVPSVLNAGFKGFNFIKVGFSRLLVDADEDLAGSG